MGAHKFMHAYYGALLYKALYKAKGVRGGSAKNVLHKEEGQENLNMASRHLHQLSPPPLQIIITGP